MKNKKSKNWNRKEGILNGKNAIFLLIMIIVILLIIIAIFVFLYYISSEINIYSKDCGEGRYAIAKDGNVYCDISRICNDGPDCSYLNINSDIPRVGICEKHLCKAYCGTTNLKKCR